MDAKISFMLEQWNLSELLEMLDIDEHEVLRILLEEGHVELPPFLEESFNG